MTGTPVDDKKGKASVRRYKFLILALFAGKDRGSLEKLFLKNGNHSQDITQKARLYRDRYPTLEESKMQQPGSINKEESEIQQPESR